MTRLVRCGLYALIGATAAVGLIGFAHTAAGRPLLNALRGAPGCPVSLDGADPERVEAFRVRELERRDGERAAASHPALQWQLGVTARSDVERALPGHACDSVRSDSVLRCRDVPERGAALHVQFDAQDRLVALDLFRAPTDGGRAAAELARAEHDLANRVGPATSTSGERSAGWLSERVFRRAASEFRYRRYVARLSAMNYGKRGIRVREQYQWSPGT